MNKRDLKDGMIVRTRGIKDEYYEYYILNNKLYLITDDEENIKESFLKISDLNDDLTHKEYKNFDIVKVSYVNESIACKKDFCVNVGGAERGTSEKHFSVVIDTFVKHF